MKGLIFSGRKSLIELLIFVIATITWLTSFYANAYACRNKQNGVIMHNGTSDVTVPVTPAITVGSQTFVELSKYYECKNEEPWYYKDYFETDLNAFSSNLGPDFEVSVTINGVKYDSSVPARLSIMKFEDEKDDSFHNINMNFSYQIKGIGNIKLIRKGDVLATLRLHKYAIIRKTGEVHDSRNFVWSLIADNDTVLSTSGCKINRGENIDINFGNTTIPSSIVNGKPLATRSKTVAFDCDSPMSVDVKFTLSPLSASFSNDAIPLSKKELGVRMSINNQRLAPGKDYVTTMQNGHGTLPMTFDLISDPRAKIPSGKFSGSSVLVMGIN